MKCEVEECDAVYDDDLIFCPRCHYNVELEDYKAGEIGHPGAPEFDHSYEEGRP